MKEKDIFSGFRTLALATLLIGMIFLNYSFWQFVVSSSKDRQIANLRDQAHLITYFIHGAVKNRNWEEVQTRLSDMEGIDYGRITVVLPSGQVVGDSKEIPKSMGTLTGAREFDRLQEHLTQADSKLRFPIPEDLGLDIRFSESFQTRMIYIATPLLEEQEVLAYVRLAAPEVDPELGPQPWLMTSALVFLVSALILSRSFARVENKVCAAFDYLASEMQRLSSTELPSTTIASPSARLGFKQANRAIHALNSLVEKNNRVID